MSPRPNGRVRTTASGVDLVITRRFRGSLEDVWTAVTDPDSSARWFGRWEGDAGPGKVIRVQMAFEETQPWFDSTITACERPRLLGLHTKDDHGEWSLELSLATDGDETVLTFVQHMTDAATAGHTGPGWEYYLDNLVAAYTDTPLPKFTDYFPAQEAYYLGEARE